MNNKTDESFSAFLDGEASELDVQRMLKFLGDNPEAKGHWHNLSKTQATLNGDSIVETALTFNSNSEQAFQLDITKSRSMRWAQGGIAAAVAIVFVTVVSFVPDFDVNSSTSVAKVTVEPIENQQFLAAQQFEAQQRLDAYLREHAEQASFTTGHVVVSSELEWVDEATSK